jgi:hypothetical protein
MGAPSKRAKRVRVSSEFDTSRLAAALKQPRDGRGTIDAWSLAQIFAAREAQMRGSFFLAARMAEQMRTDDALAVAYENRLAPQRCIGTEIVASGGARGAPIAAEAAALFGDDGVGLHPDTRADIHGCLVNHGVAFATIAALPREDGSRVDFEIHYWPIEYVRWDPTYRMFFARVDLFDINPGDFAAPQAGFMPGAVGSEVPIVHGDGRWIVFSKHEVDPFRQEAALLPAAIVWARHAYAARDWAKGSVAHGSAKIVGELPEGVPLQESDGSLTGEAVAFMQLLRAIASDDAPAGIRPSGSKVDFMTNNSTAWQVWTQLVDNAEKAAARIYLGTDGTLGANGGAPGVDITALFGVATTKVQGDLAAISRGINTGAIEPWCAINFGDSTLAPKHRYKVPNEDEDAVADSYAKRQAAFFADIKAARENGFDVTQDYVNGLAAKYRVASLMLKVAPVTPAPVAATPPGAPATPTG